MLKLNNMLENVSKQGRYTFASITCGELSGALRNNQLFRAVISMSLKNAMHFF